MKQAIIIIVTLSFAWAACSERAKLPMQPNLTNAPTDPLDSTDITLTTNTDSIAADGKAMKELILKVSADVLAKAKTAVFELSPNGTFSNGLKTITLDVDVNGEARVFAASVIPGITYAKATVSGLTRTATIRFYQTAASYPKDTLVLSLQNNNIPGNDHDYIEVIAKVKDPQVFAKMKTVRFVTDKGSFANGLQSYEVNAGSDSTARAYIKHNKAELVKITATLAGTYTEHINAMFTTSYPTQLFVEPATSTMQPLFTANTHINARLVRSVGTVSAGQVVQFRDSSAKGVNAVGAFFNTTLSGADGMGSAKYWIQDTSFRGDLFIIGEVQTNSGTVRGVNKIYVTP